MILSAALLAQYGNIKKDICYPIQRSNQKRFSNELNTSVIPEGKRLQIIAQNETHISIVMPCSSEVLDEFGNVFRIEGPYDLNCKESRKFNYIERTKTWRGQKCCGYPDVPSDMEPHSLQGNIKELAILKCGFCQNWCRVVVFCPVKEIITLDRCFWEERTTGVSIFKNNELIDYYTTQ
jgi:hypothetical protein